MPPAPPAVQTPDRIGHGTSAAKPALTSTFGAERRHCRRLKFPFLLPETRAGTSNRKRHWNDIVPLLPKFVSEGAATYHDQRKRDTRREGAMSSQAPESETPHHPHSMIPSDRVEGTAVRRSNGEKVGEIK